MRTQPGYVREYVMPSVAKARKQEQKEKLEREVNVNVSIDIMNRGWHEDFEDEAIPPEVFYGGGQYGNPDRSQH
jgi:hypothetical protein